MQQTAFAIGAHPDDIEFFMSGTLLLLRDAGWAIHYMTLADGCCGTAEYDAPTIARIRREEARTAAESVGAVFHECLVRDCEIYYEPRTLARLASILRQVAPRVILTHPPVDYMEDHMNTARLVATAAFCRGMPNFAVDPPRPPVGGSAVVYHSQPAGNRTPLGELVRPSCFVDVADKMDERVAMLARHKSQRNWLDESQGMDSYLQTLRDLAAEVGRMSGRFAFAEGWRRRLHLGYCAADEDPLREVLGERVLVVPRDAPSAPPHPFLA